MVSEGVDMPRLRVGVYATTARTELFFRQVVGRFVRRTPTPREQMSHLFLASDPRLKQLAAQVEEERNHALAQEAAGEAVAEQRERAEAARGVPRAVVERAPRRRVLQTTAPGDALQLFAEPPRRAAGRAGRLHHHRGAAPSRAEGESAHERRERLRDERRALVAASRAARASRTARSTAASTARRAPPRSPPRASTSSSAATACSSARRKRRGSRAADARCGMLPTWPDGTVAVLSTGAGAPHAIPVSTAVRSGSSVPV